MSKAYWVKVFSNRMPFDDEVGRLTTILYGFHKMHHPNTSDYEDNIIDHYHSKRPYGNKDIPASIAYNLGWDFERRLCKENIPDWVAIAAMEVHEAVLERVKEQEEYLSKP